MRIAGRLKQVYSKVMDIPDAPVKIARGVATGVAMDFLPIPIISIPIAYLVARIIGGNGVAAAAVAAFLKWAVPFFYVLNIAIGKLILGYSDPGTAELTANFNQMAPADWWDYLVSLGYPFLAGAVFNALWAWLAVYFIFKRLLLVRQRRKGIIKLQ